MANKKILIADDEPNIVKVIANRLQANGYDVVTASDGQEALEKTRQENPDLIILDVMMPKMDGFKVCRMIKFDEHHRNTLVLMLTARSQSKDEALGYETGADAYLTKPFEAQVLLDKIKELFDLASGCLIEARSNNSLLDKIKELFDLASIKHPEG